MSNMVMSFHPRVQEVIQNAVAGAACIPFSPTEYTAVDDSTYTLASQGITIDVLRNDIDASCGIPAILSHDSLSASGGSITPVAGVDRTRLRYNPAPGFSGLDTFTYTLDDGQSASVEVDVFALRPADQPIAPQPGVRVDYYVLNAPAALPDFDLLTSHFSDIVPDINFTPTNGFFGASALANNVGAVFEGYVNVTFPGLYQFATESDDGSKLWVGDRLVVDNDGLHSMRSRAGLIALHPGLHAVRVEFFDGTGTAGLIVRNAFSPQPLVTIPASAWFYSDAQPCPADFNSDGVLDFFDVQTFLAALSTQQPQADLNSDGAWNFFDVQQYLGLFSAGCP
jgi:hypothetical protein